MDGLFGLRPAHAAQPLNPHGPIPPDNDPDGCEPIESGHFESLLSWFTIVTPLAPEGTLWLQCSEPFPAVAERPASATDSSPPLELTRSWVFHRRAALPARAPDAIA